LRKWMAVTSVYLDDLTWFPEHTRQATTAAHLDSALSGTMTNLNLVRPGSGWQLGGYWLHGYLDMDLE